MKLNRSAWYWGALAVFGVLVLGVALYYQYGRNEWPCLICIHARIWVMALILVALAGYFSRRRWWMNISAHGLVLVVGAGLLERALILLGTERGTLFGECSMQLGLPPWLALDQWFPLLFEVQASCGYTPELPGGVTMAEALVVIGAGLAIIAAMQVMLSLWGKLPRDN